MNNTFASPSFFLGDAFLDRRFGWRPELQNNVRIAPRGSQLGKHGPNVEYSAAGLPPLDDEPLFVWQAMDEKILDVDIDDRRREHTQDRVHVFATGERVGRVKANAHAFAGPLQKCGEDCS